MIQIAIVEDNVEHSNTVQKFLQKYEAEKNVRFSITVFNNGLSFISDYKPVFDLVFMDIQMPQMNGMDVAKILYNIDKKVCIIFITQIAQYAAQGYEVEAVDFIIKPVSYFNFSTKLERALKKIETRIEKEIIISKENQINRVSVSQIYYVESQKHYVVYYTSNGEFSERGTISEAEKNLKPYGFSRCNNGCLVNLKHVDSISQTTLTVGKQELSVSRNRRKEFIADFTSYMRNA